MDSANGEASGQVEDDPTDDDARMTESDKAKERSADAYRSLHSPSNYHEYMRAQKFRREGGWS